MKNEVCTICGVAGRLAAPQHSWQLNTQRSPTQCAVALLFKKGWDPHSCSTSSAFLHTEPNRRGHNHAHGSKSQRSLLPALPPDQSKSFFSPSGEEKSKSITTLCSLNSENTSVSFTEDGLCTKQWKRNYFFERSFHQLTPLPSVEQQNCFSWSHPQQDLQQLNRDLGQIIPHHPSLQSILILTQVKFKDSTTKPPSPIVLSHLWLNAVWDQEHSPPPVCNGLLVIQYLH